MTDLLVAFPPFYRSINIFHFALNLLILYFMEERLQKNLITTYHGEWHNFDSVDVSH